MQAGEKSWISEAEVSHTANQATGKPHNTLLLVSSPPSHVGV